MAILIVYRIDMKENHQTLLNFAVIAGKWQKNTLFDIKSPVKNFHGRAKGGGESHRGPPLNTPLVLLADDVTIITSSSKMVMYVQN